MIERTNPSNRRPNILFFFTDDQRYDTIHALGLGISDEAVSTPNLDTFAEHGTAFTRAHIPGGTSGAVCMPSRAMLHSGRTLFRLQGRGEEIPDDHTLMGEWFGNAGYDTFGTGKWHNGGEAFNRSFDDGDEIMLGGMCDHWNVPALHYDPSGRYDSRLPYIRDPWLTRDVEYRNADHIPAGYHSTELFTDTASRFLKNRSSDQPFFCYVSLTAPHDPRTMPERFKSMYPPDDIELPPNFMAQHPFDTGALRIRDELLAEFPRTPDEVRCHIAEYYAMISHLDDAFGRLLTVLDETGERDNTIIVFAGDNGLAVGQHGLMGKQSLYDHSVRVPFMISGPGIPEGHRCDAFTYLLDVFPTLCDLVGLDIPASVEGLSCVPCLSDNDRTNRESLYLAYESSIRGVRMGDMKLIEYAANGSRSTQLFDLAQDPHELDNLTVKSEFTDQVAEMRNELVRLRCEWDDESHPTGAAFWSQISADW
jgi:arylsulfatase A-like enzyme